MGNNALVDPLSVLDLTGNDRIQGGVVDLGCYESNLFLHLPGTGSGNEQLFFDAQQQELRTLKATTNVQVEILDLSGRMIIRFGMTGNAARIDLPAGAYLAKATGYSVLRFVIEH